MEFWNFFSFVNNLHREHLELKHTYASLLGIVIQELPVIKARMEALEKMNPKHVQKKAHNPEQRMICQFCGENFKERWELETHLIIHEEAEKFSCNVCNKHFQTNWRLEKHQQNHYRKNVKVCKYFKKGQFCPFDKVGCKFLHRCSQNEKENEEENISDDESKQENHSKLNKTNMGKKDENVIENDQSSASHHSS